MKNEKECKNCRCEEKMKNKILNLRAFSFMKMEKEILYGFIIGFIIIVILQHLFFGGSDSDYNLFFQISRLLKGN